MKKSLLHPLLTNGTVRMIPLGIFAVANTVLSAWDAYNAFQNGDGVVCDILL